VGHPDVPAAQRAQGHPQVHCALAAPALRAAGVAPHARRRRGVMQLDFTRDGRMLISVGLDDSHTAGTRRDFLCAHLVDTHPF
jgi:hypothetical protein